MTFFCIAMIDFRYFGHGGTEKYITGYDLDNLSKTKHIPPALLFGCSSGFLKPCGIFYPRGIALEYLLAGRFKSLSNNSPAVLGNLWDVTDGDIDRFAKNLLERWGICSDSKMDLVEAASLARAACQLPYIVGAAPVVYGLPLWIEL